MNRVPLVVLVFVAFTALAERGPFRDRLERRDNAIADEYIVVLADDVPRAELDRVVDDLAAAYGAKATVRYRHVFQGFLARMNEPGALALSRDPRVSFVQENAIVQVGAPDFGKGSRETGEPRIASNAAQRPVLNWGLDRIDQRGTILDGTYNYTRDGSTVDIYILDSGIHSTHAEFGNRVATSTADGARGSKNFAGSDPDPSHIYYSQTVVPSYVDDCYGHGTFVASMAAGATVGVAKNARLHSVRISNCFGVSNPGIIAQGLDWVAANRGLHPVVNISYNYAATAQTPGVDALETAIRTLVNEYRASVIVSAGNIQPGIPADAQFNTPGRMTHPGVIVVASSDRNDARAGSSCSGPTVDLYAPGVDVVGAVHTANTGTRVWSGTSFAAPLVAGAVALMRQPVAVGTADAISTTPVGGGTKGAQVERDLLALATPNGINIGTATGTRLLLYTPR